MAEVVIPLIIRDLTPEDLPSCAWWVSAWDRARLAKTLERARRGEVEYLAICPPSGLPVALGGVDYTLIPGAGTLRQLAVHGALQSCGIGTPPHRGRRAADPRSRPAPGRTGRRRMQPAGPRAL